VSQPLAIAVHSGEFDRVHYALVMASAAAATGRRVTLFFTGHALPAVIRRADDGPGWHALRAAPESPAARDATLRARGVAGFEELLAACNELDVRLIVCEMALRAAAIDAGALRPDLKLEVAGVVTFLNAAADGAIVFV
jgi:peroxiredoxin family protein